MKKLIVVYLFACAISGPLFAQAIAGLGGISGVVRDASGAVVPQAEVAITNAAKGIRRTMNTSAAGVFSAPALVPAPGYSVKVTASGFTPYEAQDIQIQVGQTVDLDIALNVAASATKVEVSAAAPLVEDTKTEVAQVVGARQIQDLPINGRRVDSFVLLTPAVVPDGTFGLLSFRGIPGGNNFLTDGNDTTEQYYNENAGRTRISSQISQDAVQEFQVVSAAYSAEYGRALGGVVNTVTRSGSDDFHGTAYWFFRNRTLDATDRYAYMHIDPPEVRHQAGASVGGKIIKDKLFYFGNVEITRRTFPLVSSITQPGVISNGQWVGCGAPATPEQCAAIQGLLPRFFGLIPRQGNQELGFAKIDWRPTDRNSFSFSMNYQRFISPNGIQTGIALTNGNGLTSNGTDSTRVRYGQATWTSIITPTIVNEARFGWFKDRQADDPNAAFLGPGLGGLSVAVGGANIGAPNYIPRVQPSENRFEGADNVSWTFGKHSVKFGMNILSTEEYNRQLFNGNGSYSYSTPTDFALDYSTGGKHWFSYTQAFGIPAVDFTIHDYDFYIQDQFRVTPKLTLNYGLRYEFEQLPQPTLVNPDYPQTGRINQSKTNFGPRFGFAYALHQNKTVVRGGYGLFYGRFPGAFVANLFTQNSIYQTSISLNKNNPSDLDEGPAFPNTLASAANAKGGSAISFAAPGLRTPYTEQADIGIEHQLTTDLSLTVSYIWSRGLQFLGVRDLNIGALGPVDSYTIQDSSGNQVGTYSTPVYLFANRIDPNYQRVLQVENGANSYYNALAVQLRKRFSHGLEGAVSYTWSHAIDNNLGTGTNNLFFGSDFPRTQYNGDFRGDKGSSSLDQRHRLVVSFVEQPTFVHRDDFVSKYLINNWQLSAITTIASALPATPTIFVSKALSGLAFPSTLSGFGGDNRVPFLPLNDLRIDDVTRVDARISKILPFTERFRLYLNFEVFNLTNTISDTAVFTQAYTASNGVLKPTSNLGVGSASGGFPDGTNARRAQVSARFVW